jgi:hypothetical protein
METNFDKREKILKTIKEIFVMEESFVDEEQNFLKSKRAFGGGKKIVRKNNLDNRE